MKISGFLFFFRGLGILAFCSCNAFGLILHPEGEPDGSWTDRPPASVVGRWRTNASCVAIAPNYIITARHQGGGVGSSVFFDGVEYTIPDANAIWAHSTADLRICRIETLSGDPAYLQYYTPPYTPTNETGKSIVMGGYGDGIKVPNGTLVNKNKIYGYIWDNSSNTTQRWGSNRIEGAIDDENAVGYVTDLLAIDFDGLNEGNSTQYETAGADHDSGGGWFVLCGGAWQIIGLNLYVQGHPNPNPPPNFLEESWFRDMTNPNFRIPDLNWGARISSYATWINGIVPQPNCVSFVVGDISGDCVTDETDLELLTNEWMRTDCSGANNDCNGADFQPDGFVDLFDYSYMASGWMTSSDPLVVCN